MTTSLIFLFGSLSVSVKSTIFVRYSSMVRDTRYSSYVLKKYSKDFRESYIFSSICKSIDIEGEREVDIDIVQEIRVDIFLNGTDPTNLCLITGLLH